MTAARLPVFWPLFAVVVGVIVYELRDALVPFAAAFFIAYALDPLVGRIQSMGVSRLIATAIVTGFLFLVVLILFLVGIPFLIDQALAFASKAPAIAERLRLMILASPLTEQVRGLVDMQSALGQLSTLMGSAGDGVASVARSLLSGGRAFFGLLSLLVFAPIIAIYLLLDWQRMLDVLESLIPPHRKDTVLHIIHDIDHSLTGFLRGQSLICLFLGLWYAIGLSLAGLNFAILIGASAGFFSFIPFVGSMGGLVVALGFGLVQFWPDYWSLLMVALVFASGQFLEGNILSPRIVGGAVGLHPVWLMFSLFAFGSLFGFFGLLIAVPLAATLGVLLKHAVLAYRQSSVYLDADGAS